MSGLSTADLKEVQFLIPPITAQRKYVDYVRKVESTMEHFGHSFSNFDNLFNALMQKAFKGELNFASEAVATMEQEAENVASQLTLFD